MAHVDGQYVKACHGAVCCRPPIACLDLIHKFPVHTADGQVSVAVKNITGANRQGVVGQEHRIAALAAMAKLDRGIGAILMNGFCQIKEGGQRIGCIQHDLRRMVDAGGTVGNALTDVDKGSSALGTELIVGNVLSGKGMIRASFGQRSGCGDHAVFQGQRSKLKGGKQHVIRFHMQNSFYGDSDDLRLII